MEGGTHQRQVPSAISHADTPESTVYVKKKQWRSRRDGWFYGERYKSLPAANQFTIEVLGRLVKNKLATMADFEEKTKWSRNNPNIIDRIIHYVNLGGYSPIRTGISIPRDLPLTGAVITAWYVESETGTSKTPVQLLEDIQDKLDAVDVNNPASFRETMRDIENSAAISALEGIGIPMTGFLRSTTLKLAKQTIEVLLQIADQNTEDISATATSMIVANDSVVLRESDDPSVGAFNGVIEFANVTNISTSLSLNGDGTASFTLVNPLNVLRFTINDIDKAIADILEDVSRARTTGLRKELLVKEFREAYALESYPSDLARYLPGRVDDSLLSNSYASDVNYGIGLLQNPYQEQLDSVLDDADLNRAFGGVDANALKGIRHGIKVMRADLVRHLAGHYVVEPHDQVYIWLTSPTRVLSTIPDALRQTFVEEQSISWRLDRLLSEIASQPLTSDKRTKLQDQFNDLLLQQRALRGRLYEQSSGEVWAGVSREEILHDRENQVFEGIVSQVNDNYNADSGQYMLTIECKDVLEWARMTSTILTPSFAAVNAETNNPIQEIGEGKDKTYLWKSGILVQSLEARHATSGYTIPKIFTGSTKDTHELWSELKKATAANQVYPLQDIYANLSAANVVSLQLTGEPYNLLLFLQNSRFLGAGRFFALFKDYMKRQNDALGEFEPFKLIVSSNSVEDMQEELDDSNTLLGFVQSQLISAIEHRYDRIQDVRVYLDAFRDPENSVHELYSSMVDKYDPNEAVYNAGSKQSALVLLQDIRRKIILDIRENTRAIEMINEYIVNYKDMERVASGSSDSIIFMQHHEYLKAHKLDIVRGVNKSLGRDFKRNFLVISSLYDINEPLRAYEAVLSSSLDNQLWSSAFVSPYAICKEVAAAVDFELFSDSQGNIQFRPPEFNRVPIEFLWSYEDTLRRVNELTGLEEYGELDGFFKNTKSLYQDISDLHEKMRNYESQGEDDALAEAREAFMDRLNDLHDQIRHWKSRLLSFLTDESRIHRVGRDELISWRVTDGPPDYTYLVVNGAPRLGPLEIGTPIYFTAYGVDFDLWRSYGYISESVSKPFLHDSVQAANYCQFLLGRQRGRIFKCTLAVRGDSKYRVGDTVYIRPLNQLYYVTGVSHSFTYGTSYQTTLTLEYGRYPGVYIPHPFEAVGQIALQHEARFNKDSKSNVPKDRIPEDEVAAIDEDTKGAMTDILSHGNEPFSQAAPVSPTIASVEEANDNTPWDSASSGAQQYRVLSSGLLEVKGKGTPTTSTNVYETYTKYKSAITAAAASESIDEELILATIMTESSGRPDVTTFEESYWNNYIKDQKKWKGNAYYDENNPSVISSSYGLMQITYPTAVEMGYTGTPEGLLNPTTNITYGTKYLRNRQAADTRRTDPIRTSVSYNAGSVRETNANEWGMVSTEGHVDRFIKYYNGSVKVLNNA